MAIASYPSGTATGGGQRSAAGGPFDETFMRGYAELFYQYEEPQVMDSTAFETRFGVRPMPLPEAAATVDWFRAALAARA